MEHAMPCLIFPYPPNVCLFAAKRLCCQYSFPNSFLCFLFRLNGKNVLTDQHCVEVDGCQFFSTVLFDGLAPLSSESTSFQMKTCQNNKKFLDLTLCNVTCTYSDEIKIQNRIYHPFCCCYFFFRLPFCSLLLSVQIELSCRF